MAAPRAWGWHALDAAWARRLVDEAGITAGMLVLDIGAGSGALTVALLDAGARVVAIEVHPGRAGELRRRFGAHVTVVRADAADLRLPRRPHRVVANPPFAITTALLRRLLQPGSRLVGADIVLAEAAARRWASPQAPGRVRWDIDYVAGPGRRLPRSAFRPRSPVDVRVLQIRRR